MKIRPSHVAFKTFQWVFTFTMGGASVFLMQAFLMVLSENPDMAPVRMLMSFGDIILISFCGSFLFAVVFFCSLLESIGMKDEQK